MPHSFYESSVSHLTLFVSPESIVRKPSFSLLICALISENQGLEKSRSVSKLRKISGPLHLDFFQVYGINLAFFSRWNPGLQDLNFSKV